MKCPISGNPLSYIGHEEWVMDPDSYYVSSRLDKRYKFARHPFSWKLFRLIEINGKPCDKRYFRLNDDDTWTEMTRVKGLDGLYPLDTSNWDVFKLRFKKRWSSWMRKLKNWWKYGVLRKKRNEVQFPIIGKVHAKTIAQDLVPVQPLAAPSSSLFHAEYVYKAESEMEKVDTERKPQITKEQTHLAEHVTGHLRTVTEDNLEQTKKDFKNDNIQVGDEVYEWDMGGWMSLSGRSGEIIVRNETEFITARLTKMS